MVFFSLADTVFWQGSTAAIDTSGSTFLWIALIAGLLGLVFALFLARSVLAYDSGTPEMRLISNAIREGAEAFMSRQYTTIAALARHHRMGLITRDAHFRAIQGVQVRDW